MERHKQPWLIFFSLLNQLAVHLKGKNDLEKMGKRNMRHE